MELQEKINKRIEQLEAELEQVKESYSSICPREKALFEFEHKELDELDCKLSTVQACILELKQLLNN
jgi:hypothetical protein